MEEHFSESMAVDVNIQLKDKSLAGTGEALVGLEYPHGDSNPSRSLERAES